jgi:hypothetical protein
MTDVESGQQRVESAVRCGLFARSIFVMGLESVRALQNGCLQSQSHTTRATRHIHLCFDEIFFDIVVWACL